MQAEAYEQLREALMRGRFRPGHAITVRAAALALGTSPMPVRGALQLLEAEGALVARDHRRTLMIPPLSVDELVELRDMRILLEGHASARAADRIEPAEIKSAAQHFKAMHRSSQVGDTDGYTLSNWAFHSTIYRSSRMPRLLSAIESLWLRIGPYVSVMLPDRASLLDSLPHHEAALQALRRRDRNGVRRAIAADITDCAASLAERLADAKLATSPSSSLSQDASA